ncbi:MAG: tetratricopeptide repeat protein [Patescibacteria group bacterium]
MQTLAQQAVQAALNGQWKQAKSLNEEILRLAQDDKDALCRLARAYSELGKAKKALATYKKVLTLDPYNTIAQKAVERLNKLVKSGATNSNHTNGHSLIHSASAFLEEPGKTKTATLIHLGAQDVLTTIDTGDHVRLVPHAHRVSVETEIGDFIGRLPDDLAARIIKMTKAGNVYESLVRSATPSQVKIFIREASRGKNVQDIPSFPATDKSSYVAFTPPDLVYDERPEMETLEETFE